MKCIRKLIMTIFVGIVILCSASATCLADTVSWQLRYVKAGPAALQIDEWSKTVTTTKKTTKMSASNITNGARVYVYTSNGICSIFSTTSSTSVKTDANIKVYARVKYDRYGDRSNYPKGKLDY